MEPDEELNGRSRSDDVSRDDATRGDDTFRYIEYLQQQQIADGWSEFFRDENGGRSKDLVEFALQKIAPTVPDLNDEIVGMAREMLSASGGLKTPFESHATEFRYRPILDQVIDAANELGLPTVRPIDLVTSTDISCTPMALPTEDRHLLFAGEGTARFCSYWTKAISRVFFTLRALPEGLSEAGWIKALLSAKPSGISLAAMLAIKYAFEGTMLEFYWVPNIPEESDWRWGLFLSMLLFSIAHEYAHFVAHENNPDVQGMLSGEESQHLELWCDKLAIKILTHIGKKQNRIQIRTGAGALAFNIVLKLCREVKDLYVAAGRIPGSPDNNHLNSHPALDARLSAIITELLETAPPEDKELVQVHVDGFQAMLEMMHDLAIKLVETMIKQPRAPISEPQQSNLSNSLVVPLWDRPAQ